MHMARPALALRAGPLRTGAGAGSRWRSAPSARCRPASASSRATRFRIRRRRCAQRRRTRRTGSTLGSRDQVLSARRAARDLHAVSLPDLPEPQGDLHRLRVRRRDAEHLPEGSGSRAGRLVDGAVGRHAGKATHSSIDVTGFNDQTLVRSRPATSTASAARRRALHAHEPGRDQRTKRRSRIRRSSRGRGR